MYSIAIALGYKENPVRIGDEEEAAVEKGASLSGAYCHSHPTRRQKPLARREDNR